MDDLRFTSRDQHRAWLADQAALPAGFRVGTASFPFTPVEVDKPATMRLTLIALDRPTPDFAAMFTRNAFPGAPVIIGRQRLAAPALRAIIVNNKISNVCAPRGVETAERICAETARLLGCAADEVLPSSTGVIGWRLPEAAMLAHLPAAVAALQGGSVLPAAEGICTTDLFPKIRRVDLPGGGSVVGIAKGAGMIEPNLATMLVYLLTDLRLPRTRLRQMLKSAVERTFNRMSIDSDTSTSDTVAILASGVVPCASQPAAQDAIETVCAGLCEDIVRNGEGVHHVVRVEVSGAPNRAAAERIGKAVANSPLLQCAICGNDPNVGRLVAAIGKEMGRMARRWDGDRVRISMGGIPLMARGTFHLDHDTEARLVEHLRQAELYASAIPADGITFTPPIDYPPHQRRVEIAIDLGSGPAAATILGADRSHEYISENADYRS